jgi:hypothetical protein
MDIRQRELMLQYDVTLTLVYQNHRFEIYNDGKTKLYLWGGKLNNGPKSVDTHSFTIPPQQYYYLPATQLEKEILTKVGPDRQANVPFEIYVSDELGSKHVAKFNLLIQTPNNTVAIHTQMLQLIDLASDAVF